MDRSLPELDPDTENAAYWLARLRSGSLSPEQTREFDEWLEEPRNAAAFSRVEQLWKELGNLRAEPKILALREEARDAGHRHRRVRQVLMAAGVAALALPALGLFHSVVQRPEEPRQEMVVVTPGTRGRPITLMDGTIITVDAHSKVRVLLEEERRLIRIEHGRAHFQVAKDAARPFIVRSGEHAVVALGTAFVVDSYQDKLTVELLEGRVQVREEEQAGRRAMELSPGMRLEITPDSQWKAEPFNPNRAVGWMSGKLVFENDRLSDVVDELNRYLEQPISIAHGALGSRRLTAVLNAGDPEGFSQAIEALGIADVSIAADKRITLHQK